MFRPTFLPASFMLFALTAGTATAQSIEGSATYRERMSLPPKAVFEAVLEDVSRADTPAQAIASIRLPSPGSPPIRFTLAYDPARIQSNHQYVVRARILVNEKLLFTTDAANPVITGGTPTKVSLMLRRAQTPSSTAESSRAFEGLAGTSWQLVKFQGSDDTTLTPDGRAKYAIEFAEAGQLTARIDCNRGRGTWKSTGGGQIAFGPLALTRALCPAGSLHDQVVKQWGNIRSYVVRDGHLFLALMADGGVYEFEPTK